MNNDRFITFNRYKKPNNLLVGIDENEPFPFLNLIFNNINEVTQNINELKCIYCVKDVHYTNGIITNYCSDGNVYCPMCYTNTIVPLNKIPEPHPTILMQWHIIAYGLFAHRPLSDESYSESDDDSDDDY